MKQMLYLSTLALAASALASPAQSMHGFDVHTMTVEKPSPDDGAENLAAYDEQMDKLKAAGWRPSPKEAFLFGEKNADAAPADKGDGEQGDAPTAEELKDALEKNVELEAKVESLEEAGKNQSQTIKDLKAEAKKAAKDHEKEVKDLNKTVDDLQQTLTDKQAQIVALESNANAKDDGAGDEPKGA